MTTIQVYLQPMVWEFLERIGNKDQQAVKIPTTHRHIYYLFVNCLEHQRELNNKYEQRFLAKMTPGNIFITDYDRERYGSFIRLDRQAAISHLIYNMECDRLCQLILNAHLFTGASINASAIHFLEKYYPENGDLMLDMIKKRYQRNYSTLEQDTLHDIQLIKELKSTQKRT